jgi:uncharacterized protein with von Willebrand factor type A (vWA) domain
MKQQRATTELSGLLGRLRRDDRKIHVREAIDQSGGHLIYREEDLGLYFCGPESVRICSLLKNVFKSLKVDRRFEYARFDDFGAVFVGIKVEVRADEYAVVASALRLSGMEITQMPVD